MSTNFATIQNNIQGLYEYQARIVRMLQNYLVTTSEPLEQRWAIFEKHYKLLPTFTMPRWSSRGLPPLLAQIWDAVPDHDSGEIIDPLYLLEMLDWDESVNEEAFKEEILQWGKGALTV